MTLVEPIFMKSHNEEHRHWLNGLNLVVSIVAIVASIGVSIYVAKIGYQVNVQLNQYGSMSQIQNDLIKGMYDEENYSGTLIAKYKIKEGEETNLLTYISPEEKEKINDYITQDNYLLARMFIIVSDEKWQVIADTIKPRSITHRDLRETLLVALRQTQYPKTKFTNREDIRLIYEIPRGK